MKKKSLLVGLLTMGIGLSAMAQETATEETKWKTGGLVSLKLSQVSLSNWAGGGESSVAANGLLSLYANYKDGPINWDNTFEFGYGIVNQDGVSQKTDDRLSLSSKVGHKATEHWFYSATLDFRTQVAPGYETPAKEIEISNFLAPAYNVIALGMDYKPSDNFSLFIGPLTHKLTIVTDQDLANVGAFGVDAAEYNDLGELVKEGENFRNEAGAYLKMSYKRDIMENITFSTKLDLFSNYSEEPQNIDVTWETLIAMKVNKYIDVNLTTHLIYDDDVAIVLNDAGETGPRTQFKQVLGVGVAYKF